MSTTGSIEIERVFVDFQFRKPTVEKREQGKRRNIIKQIITILIKPVAVEFSESVVKALRMEVIPDMAQKGS